MSVPFNPSPQAMEREPQSGPKRPVTLVSLERGWLEFGISALALTLILALCWYLAGQLIQQTNPLLGAARDGESGQVRRDQDQKHNINQALLTRDEAAAATSEGWSGTLNQGMPHRTDGVVAPLWPWVASRLAPQEAVYSESTVSEADREFFVRGKWANVSIVLVFLWCLGLVMARAFRPAAVVTVLLLGAFGALLPRAVYFQPEPLYYLFFFLSWVCAVRLLIQNDLWLHCLFGVLSGLAWLAKTSVEPLLLIWFAVSAWRFLGGWFRKEEQEYRWTSRNHFFGLIIFALGWMAVVSPRYSFAEEKWGDARFTYPEAWMWFDNFAQGEDWMRNHPDKAALERMPEGTKPSLWHYAKTHTTEQMASRLVDGYWRTVSQWLAPQIVKQNPAGPFTGWRVLLDRRGIYLGAAAVVFLGAAVLMWSRRRAHAGAGMPLPCGAGAVGMFVVGTLLAYALLYGWYDPIGRGDRFMLSLYLPLVFSLVWGAENLLDMALVRHAPPWTAWIYQAALWILNAAVAWRLIEILRQPVFNPDTL